jgi:hypothetical protein
MKDVAGGEGTDTVVGTHLNAATNLFPASPCPTNKLGGVIDMTDDPISASSIQVHTNANMYDE